MNPLIEAAQTYSIDQALKIGMGLILILFLYALVRDVFDDFGHKTDVF